MFFVLNHLVCIILRAHQQQRLGKEAAEAAGLRERSRELAVETKRLAKEAEARQGRLEEARERGATAEEALRASKVWMGRWGIFWLMLHSRGMLDCWRLFPLHAGFFSWPRRGLLFFAARERKTRRDPHAEECGRAGVRLDVSGVSPDVSRRVTVPAARCWWPWFFQANFLELFAFSRTPSQRAARHLNQSYVAWASKLPPRLAKVVV